jgi:hypothetical protein
MRDVDTDQYENDTGVQLFLTKIKELTGDQEIVELDDDIDTFFDKSKRRVGESLRDYLHRFEISYQKLVSAGESLSTKAQANRMLKHSGLSYREQRELLQHARGYGDLDKLKTTLRAYSHLYGNLRPMPPHHPGGHRQNMPAPRQVNEITLAKNEEYEVENMSPISEDTAAHYAVDSAPPEPLDYSGLGVGGIGPPPGFDLDMMDTEDFTGMPDELIAEIHQANAVFNQSRQKLRNFQQKRGVVGTGQRPIRAKETPEERAKRLALAKKNTKCSACDQTGHWHMDPECPKNQNKNQVNMTSQPTSSSSSMPSVSAANPAGFHQVLTVSHGDTAETMAARPFGWYMDACCGCQSQTQST